MILTRTPWAIAIGIAMVFLASMAVGVTAADAGDPQPDVDRLLEEQMFTEDGDVRTEDYNSTPPRVRAIEDFGEQLGPDTPRLDSAARTHLVKPVLRLSIWVCDVGTAAGYATASVIGVKPAMTLIYGGVLGVIGLPVYRLYVLLRGVTQHE